MCLCSVVQSAGYMVDVATGAMNATDDLVFVDPYTMGLLVKCHCGVINCTK